MDRCRLHPFQSYYNLLFSRLSFSVATTPVFLFLSYLLLIMQIFFFRHRLRAREIISKKSRCETMPRYFLEQFRSHDVTIFNSSIKSSELRLKTENLGENQMSKNYQQYRLCSLNTNVVY